ncbi:alpha/beta hydrolase [Moraxella osloensis]|uniref:BRO-N domain-containing protein n=1 Tax=Faucicola osloensis TaxID=34062 RepID=UPI002002ACF1|nr:BRO family protein [Moraxella osloensis]MCK6157996.1 alpha/beta hydrolase [Moraxella osloensis]
MPRAVKNLDNKKADCIHQDNQSASETTNSQPKGNESMNSLTFNEVNFNPVLQNDNQIWLTSSELSKALGYADNRSVSKIFQRNESEFTAKMTTVVKLTTNGINNSKRQIDTRIFSLRGCHLIAMFARTKVAQDFRKWVLDILDKEVGQPVLTKIDNQQELSSVADRKPLVESVNRLVDETGAIYSNVWKMVHQQFNIESVDQLTKAQVKQAIAYIHSLFIVAVKTSKTQKAVNIEHIHAMYALGMNKTNENYDLLNKLQNIINDLDYFTGLVRKNTATQYSAFESIRHQVPALS